MAKLRERELVVMDVLRGEARMRDGWSQQA